MRSEFDVESRSVKIFGLYLMISSLVLALTPDLVSQVFQYTHLPIEWRLIIVFLMFVLGLFYVVAGVYKLLPLVRLTVATRGLFFVYTMILLYFDIIPINGLVFMGLLDLTGALWTAWTLYQGPRARQSARGRERFAQSSQGVLRGKPLL
ncbi:MAG: hypothetical protein KDD33_11420 [Bdellovibrionales bacterium]|nr:hypothetical protein [Bdellovibrionales bacterium]